MQRKSNDPSYEMSMTPAPGRKLPSKVFIVGTGRSGTHWLARSLRDSGFSSSMEDYIKMANDLVLFKREAQWKKLIACHRKDPRIVDKCHILLWEVERLAAAFPDALFIAIKRDENDTVKSMLRHAHVRAWCTQYRTLRIPFPSRMLGAKTIQHYDSLTLEQRCHLRWQAHTEEIDRLRQVIPPRRFLMLEYDEIEHSSSVLRQFLGCDQVIKIEKKI